MKRLALVLSVLIILTAFVGCSNEKLDAQKTMTIVNHTLSEDADRVTKLADGQMLFFDYGIDESVKSIRFKVWTKEKGKEWSYVDSADGSCDSFASEGQIGLMIGDNSYKIARYDESGHTVYTSEGIVDFSECIIHGSESLSSLTDITLDEEITLYVKTGTVENGYISSSLKDFKDEDSDVGFAVTVTFSSQELS